MLVPKLFTTLRGYTRAQFAADAVAGVIVGIVALPLAIAFAVASGVTPERGLITAVVAGFLISTLGGSRVQIGGPTGAFVVIVYGVVQAYGVDGLMVATMLAGVMVLGLGLLRLGGAIKFIPHPVVVGFTSGIALTILSGQLKDLFGLRMAAVPAEFIQQWRAYGEHASTASLDAVLVSATALAIIVAWPRLRTRVPGPFVALLAATAMVPVLGLDVETIGSRFGEIPATLPAPRLPSVSMVMITELVAPAFAIAVLASIESLLSAVVADGMIGGRHRSNMELVAQGVANIVTPLFGGIPATGAIARTATNVRNGGRTPVAGMIHAVVLLLVMLFFGRFAALIPFAALAAILVTVAYHMSEWRTFRAEFRAPRSDLAVLLVTFVLTVVAGLVTAIQVGVVLAAFLFMKRMAEVTNVRVFIDEFTDPADPYSTDPAAVARRSIPPGVQVYEINGPFFFGAAEKFKNRLGAVTERPRVLVIRMRNVPAMDSTAIHALRSLVRQSRHDGARVLLTGVHAQPMVALGRSGLLDEVGADNIFGDLDDALAASAEQPPQHDEPADACAEAAAPGH